MNLFEQKTWITIEQMRTLRGGESDNFSDEQFIELGQMLYEFTFKKTKEYIQHKNSEVEKQKQK